MKQDKMNKYFYVVFIVLALIVGISIGTQDVKQPLLGVAANTAGEPVDLIGTRVGTTTTGVYLDNVVNATTTYPFTIKNEVSDVAITLTTTAASGTPLVSFNILGSNDKYCDTSTTTTIYDVVTTGQINWADVAYTYVRGYDGSLTIPAATTTITWAPTGPTQNKVIHLTDVNSKCLAVAVNGASTTIHAEFTTKY